MIGRRAWIGGTAAMAFGGSTLARARAEGGFADLPRIFARIESSVGGRLGIAVLDTADGRHAGRREAERFPMASTFKVLAAGAILARVDAGQDSLARRIQVTRADLVEWSPVTERRLGGAGMTLAELCEAAMTTSDNAAANLLLRVLGGPGGLTAYLRGLGDEVTGLDRIEPALNDVPPDDPRDTTTPAAMLATLRRLTLGDALSPASRQQLVAWLRANRTGGSRLRARLPAGWQAGDRTGTAPRGTSNVVGLLWPPVGAAPLVVTAYLTGSPAPAAARDMALAEVGAAIVAAR
ncbi:class A beta-lactamase [Roseomonas eburnea]|uniref:Beta-lactamase n=1 Tax=Neoroseomonas eburnea TaxID=1346889 RepID=A0A9X9XFN4_9PROT|nr:class A beta-lactamase [Neoroseomonas eburnea]MBR0682520.1 class A beta-lactamase [Neoroseomonas eburnea]